MSRPSLPLYLLCGLARRRRLLSQEAALKYFLLGAFSSAFFLYGVALIYGFAGSMQFSAINEAVHNDTSNQVLLLIGMGMLSVGLLFKVGAVPFQAWNGAAPTLNSRPTASMPMPMSSRVSFALSLWTASLMSANCIEPA